MRAEDWSRIEELFHASVHLHGAERDDYIARACGGDAELRREIETLVAALEAEHSFMERPVTTLGMRVLSEGIAESLAGRSMGHYRVLRLIGQGGMGEVYLAEDSLLERPVALKFIAHGPISDEWARERLMKEAKAVARLEHPNICAIYGVEEADGHNFIVMPYLEGETLASLLRLERFSLERTLDLAEQIVSALSAAHSRGIIHRDVKPQNIVVTPDGQAKVLDFGIAKLTQQKQGAERERHAPTQLSLITGLGTAAYMSPEQARSEELDHRSDIFSFGIVLYEMLSGRNPFLRDSPQATLAAVISEDPPPLSYLPFDLPDGLERIARRCLEKEPGRRYGTTHQLLRDLRGLRNESARGPEAWARKRTRFRRYIAAALSILLLLSASLGYVYLKMSKVHTLAVLPITNESADPSTYYLSEGFTRNLFDRFSYLPRLKVRLPSAVPPGNGGRSDLARMGRTLKADAVLSGRIFKEGRSLLLHLTLLKAEDAAMVWEGRFNLEAADTFAVQDEITREVTSGLGLWLVGDEKKSLTRRQTDSEEALKLYMRGRHFWSLKRNRENIQKAISLFEHASELDPTFAKAYTGLADCYALTTNVAYGPVSTKEAIEKARYNARQALELDDSLPEAHTSMGVIRLRFDWDWLEAEREFKRAIELDSEYAPARFWYANLLAARGRFDESVRESEAARDLDPYSPLADMNYGRALYYARRYEEAAAFFRDKLKARPDYPQFLHAVGYVLLRQGRAEEAIAAFEKLHSINPLHAAAALGHAYGSVGRDTDALGMIRELDELSKTEFVPPVEKAVVYIGMGRRDEAFAALEESYTLGLANLAYLTTDPIYDDLRADPRFLDLVRRVKLTP